MLKRFAKTRKNRVQHSAAASTQRGGKVIVADGGNGQPKAVRIDIYDLGGNIALTLFDASYPSVHTCYGEKNVVFRERNISNHLFSTAKGIKFTAYGGHFVWC